MQWCKKKMHLPNALRLAWALPEESPFRRLKATRSAHIIMSPSELMM
jgi:hypothetical protein